jgi:hypothetical protein
MDEGRYYGDGVGNEMYQLQLVVVEKTPEEITRGEVEARLKERRKDDLLLHVLGRELHSHRRLPLHLLLRPQQPVVHQRLDIGLRHCRWHNVDSTHTVRGSRIRRASAAISSLGLDLDLKEHRVLMRMRSGTWRGRQC